MMDAYLILENGKTFQGKFFGARKNVTGEIVFTTGMTGYLETVTDPSYYGQIILQTFPLIGNAGFIADDCESTSVHAKAYIVKHLCQEPSNFRSEGNLDTFFRSRNITGIEGIDTRELTKIIRENGVMNGKITSAPPTDADQEEAKAYKIENAIGSVSNMSILKEGESESRVAVLDLGVKHSTIQAFTSRGCAVWRFPHDTSAKQILAINPSGVLLSSGPGNPADPGNAAIIETIKELQNHVPIFGICIGHQLLAMANGYETRKLKFGQRGSNQPVKCLETGRVYMTGQNHGYEVIADNPSFVNVNDGTCEGLDYGSSFSVQFIPGNDTAFLYDQFIERMGN